MLQGIPEKDLPKDMSEFWQTVADEFQSMIMSANSANNPSIKMNDTEKHSHSEIVINTLGMLLNDLDKPKDNSYNWHMQNTSQWVYAGAIVLEDGDVSTHH
jgi:hypothetical protein